jgi:TPR repeat protein
VWVTLWASAVVPIGADVPASLAGLRAAAERGETAAQAALGLRYRDGEGVPKDCRAAETWLRRAAAQEHAGAWFALGGLYAEGCGAVARNDTEAVRWYRRAAEGGVAGAMQHLGTMYYAGRGVPQSDAVAVKWFWRAVRHPAGISPEAAARDRPTDDVLAHFWLSVAAAAGEERAQPLLDNVAARMEPAALERLLGLLREWQFSAEPTLEDWAYSLMVQPAQARMRLTAAGEDAVPVLIAVLETAETRPFLWQICDVLIQIGPKARAAAPVLERLLLSRPTPDRLWIALALAHVDPAKAQAALPVLERCLRELPKDAPARDACAAALEEIPGTRRPSP